MPALRLLTVVGTSLLLLAKDSGVNGQPIAETVNYSVKLEHESACLSEINSARKAAGFNEFIAAKEGEEDKRLPAEGDGCSGEEGYDSWVWKKVCDVFFKEESPKTRVGTDPTDFIKGTYAYQVVDATTPSCTAVVDKWKAAYKNFSELPPSRKQGEELYKDTDNVSFVAMYNPSENAAADCRVITCTKTTTSSDASTTDKKEGHALICLTTPDVLPADTETRPFKEDEWGKIVTAYEGSASAVLPSLLGLVTATLGVLAAI